MRCSRLHRVQGRLCSAGARRDLRPDRRRRSGAAVAGRFRGRGRCSALPTPRRSSSCSTKAPGLTGSDLRHPGGPAPIRIEPGHFARQAFSSLPTRRPSCWPSSALDPATHQGDHVRPMALTIAVLTAAHCLALCARAGRGAAGALARRAARWLERWPGCSSSASASAWAATERRCGDDDGQTFCIANQKGGSARPRRRSIFAAGLAQIGQRVLAVDLDPQGNATDGFRS